jgi:hypothetical protein
MAAILGAAIDFLHALLMATWVLGLPLLFWHRWPRLTQAYAIYAIGFIAMNQLSEALLGECFLTTLARGAWESTPLAGPPALSREWFTVRMAEAIFRLTPSHDAIKLVLEALILLTAVGVAYRGWRSTKSRTETELRSPAWRR